MGVGRKGGWQKEGVGLLCMHNIYNEDKVEDSLSCIPALKDT